MIEQLITDHLDLWSSAVRPKSSAGRGSNSKLELTGIKKLRELILELAVRGKLVPQDPNDEPASVLQERIAAEKAQMIANKEIKKTKQLPEISPDEMLFHLPDGWEWVRLNDLGDWGAGATPLRSNSAFYDGGIPWFKSGELVSDYIFNSEENITELALKNTSLRLNKVGDVLVAMYGATIGKTAILGVTATTNQAVCACTPFSGFLNVYLLVLLKAYKSRLIGMGAGGAQPNISREKIIATVIALPPTKEQQRIVSKVDELMSLCDQLEQKSEASLAAHQTLVETLLATLTESTDSSELAQNWARLAQHFDSLFTTQSSIDALKQTILQLAVMGKLVPQDPNDEPASVLLERIAAEKARLVKEGKIKKEKPLPPISEEEKPFALPDGWEWCRFETIIDPRAPISYGVLVPGPCVSDGIPFVRVADLSLSPSIGMPDATISKEVDSKYNRTRLEGGEILMAVVGSIGKVGVAPIKWKGANIARALCRIKPISSMSKSYLLYLLQSRFMQEGFISDTKTLAQPTLNIGLIRNSLTPIPPIEQQYRTVTLVDELMSLCDQLSARLQASQTTQLHLAEALVEGALN
ncbi:restriction endonuclease subunit S [Aeromonas caviae]|jgi:type I restriction enzyme S subunit|uniref:restriction endonuclease subunit S n=1 Tax=Aeromonas caviae TaxID=648 RepID=UPI002B49F67C|nr:restriction endonuclease subunit S [Aeromonas caviae]